MKLREATTTEIEQIWDVLENAKGRPKSGDFLNGFPLHSTAWYSMELEDGQVENVFLFWDGSAWDESLSVHPRRLKVGVEDFIKLDKAGKQVQRPQLGDIREIKRKMRSGEFRHVESFLILASYNFDSSLVVLDGNHRIVAAFWCTVEANDWRYIPRTAWLGVSPNMSSYPYYSRIHGT